VGSGTRTTKQENAGKKYEKVKMKVCIVNKPKQSLSGAALAFDTIDSLVLPNFQCLHFFVCVSVFNLLANTSSVKTFTFSHRFPILSSL